MAIRLTAVQQKGRSFAECSRQYLSSAIFIIATFLAAFLSTGCSTAAVNRAGLQAEEGAPQSTEAAIVNIPRDPSRPTFVVAVEPFLFTPTVSSNEHLTNVVFQHGGEVLAAKMTTTLANVGNIAVIDSGLKKKNDGTFAAKIRRGEAGPYIIRATVTEFTENAETTVSKGGVNLTWVGAVLGIAGAVAGKGGLLWTGAGLAAAGPRISSEESERKGIVGIDVRIVDGKTSRVISAFKSTGTFKSANSKREYGLLGVSSESQDFAQSVIGQALQMALNDAAKQIHSSLR